MLEAIWIAFASFMIILGSVVVIGCILMAWLMVVELVCHSDEILPKEVDSRNE